MLIAIVVWRIADGSLYWQKQLKEHTQWVIWRNYSLSGAVVRYRCGYDPAGVHQRFLPYCPEAEAMLPRQAHVRADDQRACANGVNQLEEET